MYERFNDRARKVMQLANQEAQRFNHEYIGTEHILLGLVKEGSGRAAAALKSMGIDLRKIRLEIEKIVQSGPDMVTMGRLPQTPRAKLVVEHAMAVGRQRNDQHIGTEHLLIGLVMEKEGVAARVLAQLGATDEKIRDALQIILQVQFEVASSKPTNTQAMIPVYQVSRRMPPVCELVVTLYGLAYWNGREWISKVTVPDCQIARSVEWWIPCPQFYADAPMPTYWIVGNFVEPE